MKTKMYSIISSGSMPSRESWPLVEARKILSAELREEVAKCRRRYGRATLHRPTKDSGRITLGKDRDSALWLDISLVLA